MSYLHKYIFRLLIIVYTCGFVFPFEAFSSVKINEIEVQPNQQVELYNSASTSADISSWHIDDSGGSTYFTIPQKTVLHPESCMVFSSDFNFNKSSPDTVRLFDDADIPTSSSAQLIEQYSYTKAPDLNFSFGKTSDGGDNWSVDSSSIGLSNTLRTSCVPTPTITQPTGKPSPSPTTEQINEPTAIPTIIDNILISEVYAYPLTSEHEWIELYNDNDFRAELIQWYVDDGENTGSTPKAVTITINPHSYGVFEFSSSLFNNSGDSVRLLDEGKKERSSLEYGNITQGKSIGRASLSEDAFCEQEPTKNAPNNTCILDIAKQIIPIKKDTTPTPTSYRVAIFKSSPSFSLGGVKPPQINKDVSNQSGSVLGITARKKPSISPVPFLSCTSFLHSLLTIVSIFIKMKNA